MRLWEVATGKCVESLEGRVWGAGSVAFSAGGGFRQVLSALANAESRIPRLSSI
jgi:hypothetical protein